VFAALLAALIALPARAAENTTEVSAQVAQRPRYEFLRSLVEPEAFASADKA